MVEGDRGRGRRWQRVADVVEVRRASPRIDDAEGDDGVAPPTRQSVGSTTGSSRDPATRTTVRGSAPVVLRTARSGAVDHEPVGEPLAPAATAATPTGLGPCGSRPGCMVGEVSVSGSRQASLPGMSWPRRSRLAFRYRAVVVVGPRRQRAPAPWPSTLVPYAVQGLGPSPGLLVSSRIDSRRPRSREDLRGSTGELARVGGQPEVEVRVHGVAAGCPGGAYALQPGQQADAAPLVPAQIHDSRRRPSGGDRGPGRSSLGTRSRSAR